MKVRLSEATKISKRKRIHAPHFLAKSGGDDVRVYYARPKNENAQKRWGREMAIEGNGFAIKLDGRGINAIKSVLRKAGEIW